MPPSRYTSSSYAAGGPSSSASSSRNPLSKTRRASSLKDSDALKAAAEAAKEIVIEDFGPPEWRTVLNRRADLGYPDFYPSRPGFNQPEDVLTEENVKNGFVAKSLVSVGAESFSMHGPVHTHLLNGGLELLMRLGEEVLQKRDEGMPQLSERAFRIPPRVTYNDIKRLQFLADLANPDVPLHRLMTDKVPHGFKGTELLDTMYSPPTTSNRALIASGQNAQPIPVDRALWFIRVIGSNEIVAHRSRAQPAQPAIAASAPSPMPATPNSGATAFAASTVPVSSNDWYTLEFTNMFCSWLRIQLTQLILPVSSNPKAGAKTIPPPTKNQTGVLGDEKLRAKWSIKWNYSTNLLRDLHTARLISTRTLMNWFTDHLVTSNLAQLGFMAHLIGEYLNDMLHHISTARHCIRAACVKIKEIKACPASQSLEKVENMLCHVIKKLFEGNPEALLSPNTWRSHHELLVEICGSASEEPVAATKTLQILRERNEKLLYKSVNNGASTSPRRNQIQEITKLDSISANTNMHELVHAFFEGASSSTSTNLDIGKLEEKVFILLNWAMGLDLLGIHRPYAVHTILRIWSEQREEYLSRSTSKPRNIDIFPQLYNWLDKSSAAKEAYNYQAIGITFGEFTRQGMFSYSRYLQTLIARGHTVRSKPNGPPSHHLNLLRSMPIFVQAKELLHQRRIALSGDDVSVREQDEAAEVRAVEAFKEECREYVPELYGHKKYGQSASIRDCIDYRMPSTNNISRFIFLQARFELAAESEKRLKREGKIPAMSPSTFARVIHIYHLCKAYSTIADFLINALRLNDNREILRIAIDCIKRHADVWTSMDRWSRFVDALIHRFHKLDDKDVYHPRLARLLVELAASGKVKDEDWEEVQAYIDEHERDWIDSIGAPSDARSSMPELQKAISSGDVNAAVKTSQDLYDRHGPFAGWADTWWLTLIKTVRSFSLYQDPCQGVLKAAVANVEQLCAYGGFAIDIVVSRWLDTLSPTERVDAVPATSSLRQLFLVLVSKRLLSTITLVNHLVFPIWKQFSGSVLSHKSRLSLNQVQAIDSTVILAQQLLLTKPPNVTLPPLDHSESLIMQTSRAQIFNSENMSDFIRHLPLLVVLGSSKNIPEKTRSQIDLFFNEFSVIPEFKAVAFRHLSLVKDTFLSRDWTTNGSNPEIEAGMINTLKKIMSERPSTERSSIPSLSNSLPASAWRWTSVVLEMRVEFKRLAMKIENNDNPVEARQTLNQLVAESLNREISGDDADLLCETFKGIDQLVMVELLVAGMNRLSVQLVALNSAESGDMVNRVGKSIDTTLKIIGSAQNMEGDDTALLSARNRLLDLSTTCLSELDFDEPGENNIEHGQGVGLRKILKILKFVLGIPVSEGIGVNVPKADFARLVIVFLRLLISLRDLPSHRFRELQDLLVYIVDSAHSASRPAIYTALLAESSSVALQETMQVCPTLGDILPYQSPLKRHMALSTQFSGDSTNSTVPFDDRIWELFDYTATIPTRPKHVDQFLATRPMKDTASLAVALFDGHRKRDVLPGRETTHESEDEESEVELSFDDYASERNLGNGLAGEPIGLKQSTTLLYAGDLQAVEAALDPTSPAYLASSPATSISAVSQITRPRRMSMRIATSKATGTNKDPIPIDEEDNSSPKVDDEDSDDESEDSISAPPAKRPKVSGKMTRATTGGKAPAKAPARKTVSGKNVSRKYVGGKSLRGMGGKGLKGVRR